MRLRDNDYGDAAFVEKCLAGENPKFIIAINITLLS
jgi:hypothetical protein